MREPYGTRVPVAVEVRVGLDGEAAPRAILWADGRRFGIFHVLGREKARDPRTLEWGWCYDCMVFKDVLRVDTVRKRLYRFGARWAVFPGDSRDLENLGED